MTDFSIRRATQEDVPAICAVGAVFYEESNFEPGGYDFPQMAYTVGYAIESDENEVLVAVDEKDRVVGFIAFDSVRFYTKYLVSHMFLFYVLPHCRKGIGRKMVEEACKVAKEKGCKYFYGSSSAGFDDSGRTDKTLLNLYRKLGFAENGFFVRKEL